TLFPTRRSSDLPDAVGDAPDRERRASALAAPPDDDALEELRALLLPLDDLDEHADRVARRESLPVLLDLPGLDQANRIHDLVPFPRVRRRRSAPASPHARIVRRAAARRMSNPRPSRGPAVS